MPNLLAYYTIPKTSRKPTNSSPPLKFALFVAFQGHLEVCVPRVPFQVIQLDIHCHAQDIGPTPSFFLASEKLRVKVQAVARYHLGLKKFLPYIGFYRYRTAIQFFVARYLKTPRNSIHTLSHIPATLDKQQLMKLPTTALMICLKHICTKNLHPGKLAWLRYW